MENKMTLKEKLAHDYLCAYITTQAGQYIYLKDFDNSIKNCFVLAEKFIEISKLHKTN